MVPGMSRWPMSRESVIRLLKSLDLGPVASRFPLGFL